MFDVPLTARYDTTRHSDHRSRPGNLRSSDLRRAHDRLAWGQADRSLSPHAVSLELLVTLHEVDDAFDEEDESLDAVYEIYKNRYENGPKK